MTNGMVADSPYAIPFYDDPMKLWRNDGDGTFSDGPHAAAITFVPVNDRPTITANGLTVSEGQTVTIGGGNVFNHLGGTVAPGASPQLFYNGLDRIAGIDSEHRDSGEREKRRSQAHDQEVLDWCLEILRPELMAEITKRELPVLGDPRLKAKKILEEQ